MSFGNSLRFESKTPGQGSKPMIFWQQQNKDAESRNLRKQKKFGPNDKGLKYPIRGQKKPAGDDPIPLSPEPDDDMPPRQGKMSHQPPGGQNRPTRTQQINKTKPPIGNRDNKGSTQNKNASKINNSKKKPVLTGKGKKGKDKEPGEIDNGTVTLTKDQLNSILETIGVLTLEKEELEKQAHRKSREDITIPEPEIRAEKTENVSTSNEKPAEEPNQETAATDNKENQKHIQNGLPQESHTNQTGKNETIIPSPRGADVKKSPLAGIPYAHLTKAEKKRLQWERERAEQREVYEPWGRPGAGAPLKDTSGNILADFNTRKEDGVLTDQKAEVKNYNNQESQKQAWGNDNQAQNTSNVNQVSTISKIRESQNVPQQHGSVPHVEPSYVPGLSSNRPEPPQPPTQMVNATNLPTHTNQMVSQPQSSNSHPSYQDRGDGKTPPAAMRSSFTIGRIAPDENKYASTKEQQNKEWLADLQKQIDEKRLAKEREKEKERQIDTWADRMGNYKPAALPQQNQPKQTVDDMHMQGGSYNQSPNVPAQGGQRVSSAPKETVDQLGESQSSTYLRGQNVFIDPATRRELEEKRKKNMEYQEQLRLQLEERDKQKRIERERRIQEELEEERKFAAQRATFERQAGLEQQKAKQRELEKQKQVDALKEAMERAAEEAEREKHEKRMKRLQKGGHDVGGLQTTYEASKTPRNVVAHVEPSYVPGLHPTPRDFQKETHRETYRDTHRDSYRDTHREGAQSTYPEPLPLDAYTEDRVLTPTAYRGQSVQHQEPLSPRREFGVQTDFMEEVNVRREETTDIVYNGPVKSEKNKNKKVRVKSATLTKNKNSAKEETEEKSTGKLKPWGAQNVKKKKPVKNSERDPYHEIRKKKREQLRAQRQAQLREDMERNAPRVAQVSTNASRARSRSGERIPQKQTSHTRQRSRSPPINVYRDNERVSRAEASRAHSKTPHQTASNYDHAKYSQRSVSPPIPTIKHRTDHDVNLDMSQFEHHQYDQYARPQISSRLAQSNTARTVDTQRKKYTDTGPINAPVNNGDFVPFIRSQTILDPAHADSPLPPSREASAIGRARKAYLEGHQPGNFGARMENREDKPIGKDPLINPALVTDVPTSRQGQILQHLSDLRRGLLLKRREVEVGLPVDPESEASQGAE